MLRWSPLTNGELKCYPDSQDEMANLDKFAIKLPKDSGGPSREPESPTMSEAEAMMARAFKKKRSLDIRSRPRREEVKTCLALWAHGTRALGPIAWYPLSKARHKQR